MADTLDPRLAAELHDLYAELHYTCGRAATALRLGAQSGAPSTELLLKFREEEAGAAAIWARIAEIQGF